MKRSLLSNFMVLAGVALLATFAYAAGAIHKGNLQVNDPVQVNGKQLPAGDYTVTWEGEGPNADLHIAKGKKEVATATAKVVPMDQKATQDAAEIHTDSAGTRELTVLRFGGQKYELELVNPAGTGAGDTLR